jgi:hypothetical protein
MPSLSAPITRILFDGHVHLYPDYDCARALRNLFTNLGTDGLRLGLLTETSACHFFQTACENPSTLRRDGLAVQPGPGPNALTVTADQAVLGILIAGRQIVTKERLEVLAIATDGAIPDGRPVAETLDSVRERGGVPVLSWSPGKWFSRRGRLIEHLIVSQPPGSFLLGDTALRPTCWPLPRLMKLARSRGFKVIGGSDPLPLPNEERYLGTYGISAAASFDPLTPAESVRRMLSYSNTIFTPFGKRSAPLPFLRRWIANQFRGPTVVRPASRV